MMSGLFLTDCAKTVFALFIILKGMRANEATQERVRRHLRCGGDRRPAMHLAATLCTSPIKRKSTTPASSTDPHDSGDAAKLHKIPSNSSILPGVPLVEEEAEAAAETSRRASEQTNRRAVDEQTRIRRADEPCGPGNKV